MTSPPSSEDPDSRTPESIFDSMVAAGKVHLPGKGFIYMVPVTRALTYTPLPQEAANRAVEE